MQKDAFSEKLFFFLNHLKKQKLPNKPLPSHIFVKYGWTRLKQYKEQKFLCIILAVMLTQSDNHRKSY